MSDTYTNPFGETIRAKVKGGEIVFYCDDPIIDKKDLPWRVVPTISGYLVQTARGGLAIVDQDELAWMVNKYLEHRTSK
jgi:hypothetical protein